MRKKAGNRQCEAPPQRWLPKGVSRTRAELRPLREFAEIRSSSLVIPHGPVSNPPRDGRRIAPNGPMEPLKTTVWSFPARGSWGPHLGNYRGNWSPHVPRNLILKYTVPGDLVLDPMVGGGTTLVECLLLGRNGIGVDVNPESLLLAMSNLKSSLPFAQPRVTANLFHGDARDLETVRDNTVNLVTLHPPYADIIRYSDGRIERDLSTLNGLDEFFHAIHDVARESLRVLRPGGHCAVLMGDTRTRAHLVPLSFRLFQEFLDAGFIVREHIIKLQWNTTSERTTWAGKECSFYKLAHENLFVFRKPEANEGPREFASSRKWWATARSPIPPK